MVDPVVSVIIPIYNAEKFLEKCIDSVIKQTFDQYELILVNDGSIDDSPKICQHYSTLDERIVLVHQENKGVSSARNKGIKISKGKYITFIDSDDVIDNDFLKDSVNCVEHYQSDLYVSGIFMENWASDKLLNSIEYKIRKSKVMTTKTLFEKMEIDYPFICINGPWCKLYKKSIIKKYNLLFDESMVCGEDTIFNLNYLKLANNIIFSEKSYYHYRRINELSLFSRLHKDTYEIHTKVYDKMRDLLIYLEVNEDSINNFENLYFTLLIGGIHEFYSFKSQTTRMEKKDLIVKISNNLYLNNLEMNKIKGIKSKIIFIFIKLRLYRTLMLIFDFKYRFSKRGSNCD